MLEEPKQLKTVGSGRLWGTSAGEELLDFLGLSTLLAVEEFSGGEVVNAGGHRLVRKLQGPQGEIAYLKQSFRASGGGLFQSVLKRGKRYSASRLEAANLLRLGKAGFTCAEVLAFGEDIKGLSEGFSFLLTLEVAGDDLETYLSGHMKSYCRTEDHDLAVISALVDLSTRLINLGFYFEDLVPKHIYLSQDKEGGVVLSLIDVARLDVSKAKSVARGAKMLAKLNVNLPLAQVGHSSRIRFLRAIELKTHLSLFTSTHEETERLLAKRRYRFVLSPYTRPPNPKLLRSSNGRQAWVADFVDPLKLAQIDAGPVDTFEFAKSEPEAQMLVVEGSHEDIKLMVNLHSALSGWVKKSDLVGWEIGSGDAQQSWAGYCPADAPWLKDSLATLADSKGAILAHNLSQVLSAFLQVGVLPGHDLLGVLKWQNDVIIAEFKPPFRTKDLNVDSLGIQLAEELTGILGPRKAESLVRLVQIGRRGPLGSRMTLVR